LLEELALKILADVLRVHEVTVATSVALALIVLTALCLPEVGDGRVLCNDDFSSVVTTMETPHGGLGLLLRLVLDIDIANHVLADVVSDHDLVELTVLCQFAKDLFIEVFKVVDCLDQVLLGDVESVSKGHRRWRIIVQVGQHHRL
jgi:hypothetical protein